MFHNMAGKMAQWIRVFVALLVWILAPIWRLTAITLVPEDPTLSVYAEYQVDAYRRMYTHTCIYTHIHKTFIHIK